MKLLKYRDWVFDNEDNEDEKTSFDELLHILSGLGIIFTSGHDYIMLNTINLDKEIINKIKNYINKNNLKFDELSDTIKVFNIVENKK